MRGWFGPKFSGIGISPRSWGGWLATAVLVAGLVYHRFFFRPELWGLQQWAKPASGACLIALYLILVYFTYDADA